ncbi:Ankyrin repeat protein nuc-2 [Wickerhamiella sorbophila]|uniref:Ankyrin repeat protein nuc-2 n=1 Tax=Wickerhamiella sorbophila TaxID=45607 RepID=A0A2T0FGF9_9ASCO|nr:Ankyrin repeat protein nuc-2 [Wickerhamiella sorbophila]PRT54064.1 Ankyrin repeat protein nuc-2 [Wickerhamiella sorbophila]
MKFGKYLAKRHLDLPEYANYFIDYKALKKLIKRLAAPDPQQGEQSREFAYKRLQENKATFFFQLERELEKVQNYYEKKESELEARIARLELKKTAAAQSGALSKNSVAYISLYEGLQRFRRDLERLEQFIELNGTGFYKVLKKWDKRSRSHLKELYLARAVEVQPMFHREKMSALSDKVNQYFLELEALASGSDQVVFEPNQASQEASRDRDLCYEFIKFAQTYSRQEPDSQGQMDEWISQLTRSDDAKKQITSAFLMAMPTKARDDALLALIETRNVDMSAVDEIAGRNCLHLAASTDGREKIVALALKQNVNASLQDVYGRTPLHYAATYGRRDFLNMFLAAGVDVNTFDHDNYSALHYSIFNNFSGITEDLVNAGASTEGDSERNYIPLNFACQYGAFGAVKILLAKQQNGSMVPDAEGLYPIHIVARAGFANIVPLLVDAGADVNQLDKLNGWTALMYAASEGHVNAVNTLLDAKADWRILDEKGYSALFYATFEGRPASMRRLIKELPADTVDISADNSALITQPQSDTGELVDPLDEMDLTDDPALDLDGIPSLALPPPIMPLQRYGHNFLDSKKTILQLTFAPATSSSASEPSSNQPTKFTENRKFLSVGRMTVSTSGTRDSIPRNVALPLQDSECVLTFQIENIDKFSIDFEVFPMFGTRLLAKTTALPSTFAGSDNTLNEAKLPMMDVLLRPVGELDFNFLVVKPYAGKPLEIAKYETYWKSTTYVDAESKLSIVTASSLVGTYHNAKVVLTRDLVPVVMDVYIDCQGVKLGVPILTLEEVRKVSPRPVETLAEVLARSDDYRKLDLIIPYPTIVEQEHSVIQWPGINEYADRILHVVFDYAREMRSQDKKTRSIMFSSPNPGLCAVINWKQPNYPVLFRAQALHTSDIFTSANSFVASDCPVNEARVSLSIKEAAHFAATNNLMGVIVSADVLKLVPAAITATRMQGLVLVASSEGDVTVEGCDGVETKATLHFKTQAV